MDRMPTRRLALRVIAGTALAALAACGRKGSPKPPPDADPLAPRVYPVDRSRPPEERPRRDDLPPPVDPSLPQPGAPALPPEPPYIPR